MCGGVREWFGQKAGRSSSEAWRFALGMVAIIDKTSQLSALALFGCLQLQMDLTIQLSILQPWIFICSLHPLLNLFHLPHAHIDIA